MPATAVTDKIVLTVTRVKNGFTIQAQETGSNEQHIADASADINTKLTELATEWAGRTAPAEG